jgi:hypothetical protein
MARETAMVRWPELVKTMIVDVEKSLRQAGIREQARDGRRIQATLRIIQNEIMENNPCTNMEARLHGG